MGEEKVRICLTAAAQATGVFPAAHACVAVRCDPFVRLRRERFDSMADHGGVSFTFDSQACLRRREEKEKKGSEARTGDGREERDASGKTIAGCDGVAEERASSRGATLVETGRKSVTGNHDAGKTSRKRIGSRAPWLGLRDEHKTRWEEHRPVVFL